MPWQMAPPLIIIGAAYSFIGFQLSKNPVIVDKLNLYLNGEDTSKARVSFLSVF